MFECRGTFARGRLDGRWVAPANYHVTVAFLGSVDEALVDRIVAALRALVPQLEPLDVPIDAVGAFPDARRARVAWAGPAEPVPAFAALCRLVRDALAALDLRFDQHADPHVTLARAVGLRAELPYVEPPSTPSLRIGSLTLYESVVAPGGARYDALEWLPRRRGAGVALGRAPSGSESEEHEDRRDQDQHRADPRQL